MNRVSRAPAVCMLLPPSVGPVYWRLVLARPAAVAGVFCWPRWRAWSASSGLPFQGAPAAGRIQNIYRFVSAFYVGLAGLQVGDDVRADAKLQQATELVPAEPAGWIDWGVLALRQRNFDLAAQRLERAHTLAPNDDRVDYLLGLLEGDRGNSDASISYLHQAIARNPRNLRALYTLATQVERQGSENSDAELQKIFEQILSVQPENLAVLVDLAAYPRNGEIQQRCARRSRRLKPAPTNGRRRYNSSSSSCKPPPPVRRRAPPQPAPRFFATC